MYQVDCVNKSKKLYKNNHFTVNSLNKFIVNFPNLDNELFRENMSNT
jgi:hypothetical protein